MRQIKETFDVTGFVAEENSGLTDKNGKRSVLKLEFSIIIEKEHNPNPGSERKKKKHRRAVQGGKGAGELDLRSCGGPSKETRPYVTKNKEGKKTKKKRANQGATAVRTPGSYSTARCATAPQQCAVHAQALSALRQCTAGQHGS
jgi:hypothetical protein